MFCMLKKKEKIYLAYVSKQTSKRGKQFILIMIPNWERWHYIAVERLSALKRNNFKTRRCLLFSELPSFFHNRKQT